MKVCAGFLIFFAAAVAHAGQRTSASYSVITDTVDFGGQRATSGAYTTDNSISAVTGLATVATPVEIVKSGYIGQLYDITGLSVTAGGDPATVEGGGTVLLGGWQTLDDGSYLAVDPGSVTWSVVSGPITSISSDGLATAAAVSQNTVAIVHGVHASYTGTLGLTVMLPSAAFTSATQIPIISDGYTAAGSSIDLTLGFAPTTGTVLTVVENTGSAAIQGTFSNLAQGQTVNLSYAGQSYTFVANYNGGSNGRSLVLQLVASVPAMPKWALLTLGSLLLALGARRLSRSGDDRSGRSAQAAR